MNNITFAIIKPDAVKNRNTGKIYDRIISAGFEIKSAKLLRMTQSLRLRVFTQYTKKDRFLVNSPNLCHLDLVWYWLFKKKMQ